MGDFLQEVHGAVVRSARGGERDEEENVAGGLDGLFVFAPFAVVCESGALFGRGWQLDLRKSSQWYAEYPAMLAKWKHAVW